MRLGTRASPLALAQASAVAELLGGAELVEVATHSDARDKSRWVRGLERALLDGEIDAAVHSAKDMPGELPPGLSLVAAPARAPADDVLCGADALDDLSAGATVGTSSLRRVAQLRAARADVEVIELRGNVDTRLAALQRGDFDAIVLARAGLERLGLQPRPLAVLDADRFVPAPGQGALALQARADDSRTAAALEAIGEAETVTALRAERGLARAMGASCNTPLGAHARLDGGSLALRAWVGLPDGSAWIADELCGDPSEPEALARALAARMTLVGAGEMLERAAALAPATVSRRAR